MALKLNGDILKLLWFGKGALRETYLEVLSSCKKRMGGSRCGAMSLEASPFMNAVKVR